MQYCGQLFIANISNFQCFSTGLNDADCIALSNVAIGQALLPRVQYMVALVANYNSDQVTLELLFFYSFVIWNVMKAYCFICLFIAKADFSIS